MSGGLRSVGHFSRSLAAQNEYDKGYDAACEAFAKRLSINIPPLAGSFHFRDGWRAASRILLAKTCSICGSTSQEAETIQGKILCQECAIDARDLMAMGYGVDL